MDPRLLQRAVDACTRVATVCGLPVDDAVVLHDSNRLAVRLLPCRVLARVAPSSRRHGAEFEVAIAQRLERPGSPLATLDPRVAPAVHDADDFAVTLWTYYEPRPPSVIGEHEYATALTRLHAAMREADVRGIAVPHFTDRVDEAAHLIDDPTNNPDIGAADRELLSTAVSTTRQAIERRGAPEQLLHGEPHPGNLLRTEDGLRFVDLETCCRGPIEFDLAHASVNGAGPPVELARRYAGADPDLVRDCWILMLAMVTAWRCEPGDDLPDGRALTRQWIGQLRAALEG